MKGQQETKERVDTLAAEMQVLRRRLEVIGRDDWKEVMAPWLEQEMEACKNHLTRPDLPTGETTAIRGQFWALQKVYDLPKWTRDRMLSIAEEAGNLQRKLDRWHTRGHEGLDTALNTAEKLTQT